MGLRQFTDNNGRVWEVWETRPTTTLSSSLRERIRAFNSPTASSMMQGLEQGWLTFRSGAEKRRLTPIPERWVEADDSQLQRWWKRAAVVPAGTVEERPREEFGEPRSPI